MHLSQPEGCCFESLMVCATLHWIHCSFSSSLYIWRTWTGCSVWGAATAEGSRHIMEPNLRFVLSLLRGTGGSCPSCLTQILPSGAGCLLANRFLIYIYTKLCASLSLYLLGLRQPDSEVFEDLLHWCKGILLYPTPIRHHLQFGLLPIYLHHPDDWQGHLT